MATQPNAVPEGDDEPLPVEGGEVQPEAETEEPGDPPADDPVAKLAVEMGWVPQDRYSGDPAKWKPAEQYIRDGRDIQRDQSRELRELRSTMDTVARTNAQILADRLDQQKEELTRQYNQAVEDGDAQQAFNITTRIHGLNQQAVPVPPAEVEEWKSKHGWFNTDPLATRLAVQTCEEFKHLPVSQQLELAEREVRRFYPDLFPKPASGKPAPGVADPGGRAANQNRGPKGAKDMPPAAQKVARDMVDRGVIANVEAYATQYWKQQASQESAR